MFPKTEITINFNTPTDEQLSGRVFLFDFVEKKHVFEDGKPVVATYEQAIQQWLTMLLITEMDKFEVYKESDFGLSIRHLIGRRDMPVGVINSEIKRQIEEKSVQHPEILGVENFTASREGSKINISFNVATKQGLVQTEVSIGG